MGTGCHQDTSDGGVTAPFEAKCIGNKYDMELYHEWYDRSRSTAAWSWSGKYDTTCDRLGKETPGWCTWEWGRPGYYDGTGQYLQAAQVCPQCGYCIDNGKQAGDPGNNWDNQHWVGDPIAYEYY